MSKPLNEALGMIETKGLIASIAATDAMAKAAKGHDPGSGRDRQRLRRHLLEGRCRLRPAPPWTPAPPPLSSTANSSALM